MTLDYDSLFEGVKNSLEAAKTQNYVSYNSLLKLATPEKGQTNSYIVRLLPYNKEGKEGIAKTFFYYEKYFWRDNMGKINSVLSRRTFHEPCPINRYQSNIKNNGSAYEKEQMAKRLWWSRGWYCNVYVVNDPVNPENNGKVKVLSLNKTLWTIVENAMQGGLDDEWSQMASDADPSGREIRLNVGRMIFDLTDNGINLNIQVGRQGEWADYKQSRFTRQKAKLGFTEEQQKEILEQCQDVTTIEKEMTADEIYAKFKETYLNESVLDTPTPEVHVPSFKPDSNSIFDNDDIPGVSMDNTVDEVKKFASNWMSSDFE